MRLRTVRLLVSVVAVLAFSARAHAGVEVDLATTPGDWAAWGSQAYDGAGASVHIADLDGDGISDLVIGETHAPLTTSARTGTRACIFFGPLTLPSEHDLLSET